MVRRYGHSSRAAEIEFEAIADALCRARDGTIDAANPFVRRYVLSLASDEALLEMVRTSSAYAAALDLRRRRLGRDPRLPDALASNTVLTALALGGNGIDHRGGEAIAASLLGNTVLTALDLGRNRIGDRGLRSIARALRVPRFGKEALEHLTDCAAELADCR